MVARKPVQFDPCNIGVHRPIVSYGRAKRCELRRRAERMAEERLLAETGIALPGRIKVVAWEISRSLGVGRAGS